MSWSVSTAGKRRDETRAEINKQIAGLPRLKGSEEGLKQSAIALVLATIASQSADRTLNVSANGSGQITEDFSSQDVSISITSS